MYYVGDVFDTRVYVQLIAIPLWGRCTTSSQGSMNIDDINFIQAQGGIMHTMDFERITHKTT